MSYVYEKVKQYDNLSRKYRIMITDKGNMVSLKGNEAIRIRMWADGESAPYVDDWLDEPWENGYPILIMTSRMLSKVGKVKYEFVIQEPGSPAVISTRQQNLLIQKSLIDYDGIIASEDFDVLSHLIGQATTIPDLINDINVSLDDVSNKISEVNSTMAEYERQMQTYATEYGEMKTDMQDVIDALHVYMENVENSAASSAKLSESWAIGGTNSRDGEATNNSKFHSDQSKLYSLEAKSSADRAEQFAGNVDPKTLFQIKAIDSNGMLGNQGSIVDSQSLVDEISTNVKNLNISMSEANSQLALTAKQVDLQNEIKNRTDAIATEKLERQQEVAVERTRINSFTALATGSTTGDAELIDTRIGSRGEIYPTAGEAVRGQINSVVNGYIKDKAINAVKMAWLKVVSNNIFAIQNIQWTNYAQIQFDGTFKLVTPDTLRKACNYVEIEPNTNYYYGGSGYNVGGMAFAWYDVNKKFISMIDLSSSPIRPFLSPVNAKYLRTTAGIVESVVAPLYLLKASTYFGASNTDPLNYKMDILLSDDFLNKNYNFNLGWLTKSEIMEMISDDTDHVTGIEVDNKIANSLKGYVSNWADENAVLNRRKYDIDNCAYSWWVAPRIVTLNYRCNSAYFGYVDSAGIAGVAEIDIDDITKVRRTELSNPGMDDHNGFNVFVTPDNRLMSYGTSHNNDNMVRLFFSKKPGNAEYWSNRYEIIFPGTTTYAQTIYDTINHKYWVFTRVNVNSWWGCCSNNLSSGIGGTEGTSWGTPFSVVTADRQYYCGFIETTNPNLLRIVMYSNPNITNPDTRVRMGFVNLTTGDIYNSDGVTVLGNISTGGVDYTKFNVLIDVTNGYLNRLFDVAVTDPSVIHIAYATFTNYQDGVYKVYRNGVTTTVVATGTAFYYPSMYYGGIIFEYGDAANTVYLSRNDSNGYDRIEKYVYSNGWGLSETIKTMSKNGINRAIRPAIDKSNKILIWQEGVYNTNSFVTYDLGIKFKKL